MIQTLLMTALFVVIIRFHKYAFTKDKPTFKKELYDFIIHLLGSYTALFVILFFIILLQSC